MAEKNKKRGGRRAHLNDFHVNLAGDYVYTGAHYSYVDQGRSRDRVQRELLGLSVAVVLAVVAGGCSDAPAMLNCWYVILPYICEAAAAVSTGASLAPLMVTVRVLEAVPPCPSETLNVKVSVSFSPTPRPCTAGSEVFSV